jgi:hypothetical protein
MYSHYPSFRSASDRIEAFPACFSVGFATQQANVMQSIARSGIRLVIMDMLLLLCRDCNRSRTSSPSMGDLIAVFALCGDACIHKTV